MSDRVVTHPRKMEENWRIAICALMNMFLAAHRTLAEPLPIGPTEMLIYVTIAVANVQKLMRERTIPPAFAGKEVLPREWVVPISRNAIATASGLPRETVRRQVGRMIEMGMLIDDPRGGVTLPVGSVNDPRYTPLLEAMLTEFTRTAEVLLRIGVIEIQTS